MDKKRKYTIFTSFEDENRAERMRRARMSPEERCREFAYLQERQWGKKWTSQRILKKVSFEKVSW